MSFQNLQQVQTNNNNIEDRYREIANALLLGRADTQTQLGYALGKYLGNFVQRNNDNAQRAKLDAPPATAADNTAPTGNSDNITSALASYIQSSTPNANNIGQNNTGDAISNALNNQQQTTLQQVLSPQQTSTPTSQQVDLLGSPMGTSQPQANSQPSNQPDNTALDKYLQSQGLTAANTAQQMALSAPAAQQNNLQTQQQSLMDQTQQQAAQAMQDYQIGQQQKKANLVKIASMIYGGGGFDQGTPDGGSSAVPEAQQPQQSQQLDYIGRNLAGKLIAAKQAYAQAETIYNNPKSDDEKNKALAMMQQASAAADSVRQSAQSAGIDLSQYGANTTLEKAAQNLQNDFYTGVRNILGNDISSDEYYMDIFNQVKKNGGTDRQANMLAGQKAAVYQAQRMARLSNAFENYGLNPTGSINNIGAQILMQMQQENPNEASGYASLYASPKDDYTFNKQISLQNNQSNNALRNETTLNNQKFTLNEKHSDNELTRKEKFAGFNANLTIQMKSKLAQIELATKGMDTQQQIAIKYNAAKQLGMSDEDARTYALGGRGNGSPKVDKADQRSMNNFEYLYENAMQRDENGQISADAVDALKDAVDKDVGKYDGDTRDYLNSMVLAAEGLREKAAGNENSAAAYWDGIPDYLKHKLLPDYYGTGD